MSETQSIQATVPEQPEIAPEAQPAAAPEASSGDTRSTVETSESAAPAASTEAATSEESKSPAALGALCGFGAKWADVGLDYGRSALEKTARTLEQAAQKLAEVQAKLKAA